MSPHSPAHGRHGNDGHHWQRLPRILGDVDEDLGDGRSKENLLRIVPLSVLAVDVHVQLQLDVLRPVNLADQLDDHLVRPDPVEVEEGAVGANGPRPRVAGADDLQLELQPAVGGQRAAHREEVGRDADQAPGDGDEVDGVGDGRVKAIGVSLGTGERLAVTSDGVTGK